MSQFAFKNLQNIMLFISHIQLQLVSLVFLVILEVTYFKRKKLPIRTTACFSSMMIFALLFVILDSLPSLTSFILFKHFWTLRLIYQLRIYAYISVTVSIYLYVTLILGRKQHLNKSERLKVFAAYGLAVVAIILSQARLGTFYELHHKCGRARFCHNDNS